MLAKSVASAGDVFGGTYKYRRVYVGGAVGVLGGGDGEREERAESERGERFRFRAGRGARGMYLAKKSATAKESGMVVSQAIASARRILEVVFVEAKEKENTEAVRVAEKAFEDLVTMSRSEEDGCLSGAIDCEYKRVQESTVATIASLELCNALVESHFDLFQKNQTLMKTLKERFCPIVEATLEKKFFCAAETTDFAQRRVVLRTLEIIVKIGRGDGFEEFIKTSLARLMSSLESEMPAWLRARSSLEVLRFFCSDDDICSFLHDAYCDPTKMDDANAETPLASICLIQARTVQSGLSASNSEPTTSSSSKPPWRSVRRRSERIREEDAKVIHLDQKEDEKGRRR